MGVPGLFTGFRSPPAADRRRAGRRRRIGGFRRPDRGDPGDRVGPVADRAGEGKETAGADVQRRRTVRWRRRRELQEGEGDDRRQ